MFERTENFIGELVEWLKLFVESAGAVVIGIAMILAIVGLLRMVVKGRIEDFNRIRLRFARGLVLALEFQLAADILGTAIAPNWDQIMQLGAIAVIRTGLSFFLHHEMKQEQAELLANG